MSGPRRLILDHEDPFQRVQVALNGLRVQRTRASARIGRDDGDRRLGGHVPGQRLQHPPDQHRIAAHTVHAPEVGAANLVQVVTDEPPGIVGRSVDRSRPAAPADELDEVRNPWPRRAVPAPAANAAWLPATSLRSSARTRRATSGASGGGTSGPAPVCRVVSSGGTAEPVRMNRPAPPPMSAARRTWFQMDGALCHSSIKRGAGPSRTRPGSSSAALRRAGVHVEQHLARGVVPAGRRLPTGSGPLDEHRSGRPEPDGELLVDDAWAVLRNLTQGGSPRLPGATWSRNAATGNLQHG